MYRLVIDRFLVLEADRSSLPHLPPRLQRLPDRPIDHDHDVMIACLQHGSRRPPGLLCVGIDRRVCLEAVLQQTGNFGFVP
jgi:hypothetical protein